MSGHSYGYDCENADKGLTNIPIQTLNLFDLIHAMPPVTAALHSCKNAVPLEFGLQIVHAQLCVPQALALYPQLQCTTCLLKYLPGIE